MRKPYRRADARGRDERLRSVLEQMLERGERISARGLLKHVPDLRAASSVTRDPVRRLLLEEFRRIQEARNTWVERAKKQSTARLERTLSERDVRIVALVRIPAKPIGHSGRCRSPVPARRSPGA